MDWTTITKSYPIPVNTTYFIANLVSAGDSSETGQVWFDDISAVLVDAPCNLLSGNIVTNADMESPSPAGWSKGGTISPGQLTWATDSKIAGNYSLKIDDNSSTQSGQWYQYITIPSGSAGKDMVVRWSWKCNMTAGRSLVVFNFFDSSYTFIKCYIHYCGGTMDWTTVNDRFPIPANAAYLVYSLQTAGDLTERGQVWMDNASAVIDTAPSGLSRIAAMSDDPSPYQLRNWKQVAIDLDTFVYDFNKTGTYLPTIWWDTTSYNYPATGYGIPSYIGPFISGGNNHEGVTVMGLDIGASLCGINKSSQNGYNFAAMEEKYYETYYPLEQIYLNNIPGTSGTSFWYDLFPSAFFFQLASLYPNLWANQANEMASTADQWYNVMATLGGSVAPYAYPNLNHTAFNLSTSTAYDNGQWTEPDSGAMMAWIEYMYYIKTGNTKYLTGAQWAMDFIQNCSTNPLYATLLFYAPVTAQRMNCEQGKNYDVTKMLQWCLNGRDGWGPTAATWGGYSVDGLVSSGDYAFEFETIQAATMIAPVVRYNQTYAAPIGKYLMNVANSTRLFYPYVWDSSHQTCSAWATTYDAVNSCIAYEGLKKEKYTYDRASADYSTSQAPCGQIDSFDDLTNWIGLGTQASLDTTTKHEGTGSMKCAYGSGLSWDVAPYKNQNYNLSSTVPLMLTFWEKSELAGKERVNQIILTDTSNCVARYQCSLPADANWTKVYCPLSAFVIDGGATFDWAHVRTIQIWFTSWDAMGSAVWIDDMRIARSPGTIYSGGYNETHGKDNIYEVFQESPVGNDAQLEHIWTIPLSSGYFHQLVMCAKKEMVGGGGDDGFNIYWSTDPNGPWNGPVFNITATTFTAYWTPSIYTNAGTIYVRATDNTSSTASNLNKLYVDDLFVETRDNTIAPYASGDPLSFVWGNTDLGLYGSGQIGYLGSMVSATNVDKILKVDLLKTDFYHATAYPTYLYYNPYTDAQTVNIDVGSSAVDVYNTISGVFLLANVTGVQSFSLSAKTAAVLVLCPNGGAVTTSGTKLSVGGTVVDYQFTPWLGYPSSYVVRQGAYNSGVVGNLTVDDTSYLMINSTASGTTRYATTDFTVTGVSKPSKIDLTVVTKSNTTNTTQTISLWNYITSAWDQKDTTTIGTTEVTRTASVTTSATNYVSGGTIKVRVYSSHGSSTSFVLSHDQIKVGVTPGP